MEPKFFEARGLSPSIKVEKDILEWLKENPGIRIIDRDQSECGVTAAGSNWHGTTDAHLTVCIWFIPAETSEEPVVELD